MSDITTSANTQNVHTPISPADIDTNNIDGRKNARAKGIPDAPQPKDMDTRHNELPTRATPPADAPATTLANLSSMKDSYSLMTEAAALFLLAMLQQRNANRQAIMADGELKMEAHNLAADDIKQSAIAAVIGSTIAGTISIGSGITSGAAATKAGFKEGNTSDPMAFQNKMMKYQNLNQTSSGVGQVINGGMSYQSKAYEAQKEGDEAVADQANSIQESDRSNANEDQQLIQTILQTLEKIEEARDRGMPV